MAEALARAAALLSRLTEGLKWSAGSQRTVNLPAFNGISNLAGTGTQLTGGPRGRF